MDNNGTNPRYDLYKSMRNQNMIRATDDEMDQGLMENAEARRNFHEFAQDKGFVVGDYDSFVIDYFPELKKKEAPTAIVPPQNASDVSGATLPESSLRTPEDFDKLKVPTPEKPTSIIEQANLMQPTDSPILNKQASFGELEIFRATKRQQVLDLDPETLMDSDLGAVALNEKETRGRLDLLQDPNTPSDVVGDMKLKTYIEAGEAVNKRIDEIRDFTDATGR